MAPSSLQPPHSEREAFIRSPELLPPLPKAFYLKPTVDVARSLLGKGLFVRRGKRRLLVRIVEVEAYLGPLDPASHAYRGKTKRNSAMFEEGGTCYVYLSYGINYCMNVAAQGKGTGEAVLLRAAEPLEGVEEMLRNRGLTLPLASAPPPLTLLNGPGKLCQALGIDLRHNGLRFDREDFKLIELGKAPRPGDIAHSPRIGISKAKDAPLRFFLKSSCWLSRNAARLPRPQR